MRRLVGKIAVQGILERGGHIRARVLTTMNANVVPAIRENVEAGSKAYTDQLKSYFGLQADYEHGVINHAEMYVNGQIHTNGLENFWSPETRTGGHLHCRRAVSPVPLCRRASIPLQPPDDKDGSKMSEEDRLNSLCNQIVGRRLTYKELTGKEDQRQEEEAF